VALFLRQVASDLPQVVFLLPQVAFELPQVASHLRQVAHHLGQKGRHLAQVRALILGDGALSPYRICRNGKCAWREGLEKPASDRKTLIKSFCRATIKVQITLRFTR
jgi:hypothetical protein